MDGGILSRTALLFFRPLTPTYWRGLAAGFAAVFGALFRILARMIRERCLPRRRYPDGDCCVHLPPSVYKRADPLIYAQYYLMTQGLAVTWDNPDIDIVDGAGNPVLGPLSRGRTYRVRVRVWNGSYDAPAVGLLVELSYLSFGAQTLSNPIASAQINLGAKGASDCPAYADFTWRTPRDAGHYCLQARLIWSDDANPDNNLGQKNVAVANARSPARFAFAVRNTASVPKRFAFAADGYALRPLQSCREQAERWERPKFRRAESEQRWRAALEDHGFGRFALGEDWRVTFEPEYLSLEAGEQREVRVAVEPLDAAFRGTHPVNVNVFMLDDGGDRELVGGVTLIVARGRR